jgi:hypothetical protein
MTTVATIHFTGKPGVFHADQISRQDGMVCARGQFVRRYVGSDDIGPVISRWWPMREIREIRFLETAEQVAA